MGIIDGFEIALVTLHAGRLIHAHHGVMAGLAGHLDLVVAMRRRTWQEDRLIRPGESGCQVKAHGGGDGDKCENVPKSFGHGLVVVDLDHVERDEGSQWPCEQNMGARPCASKSASARSSQTSLQSVDRAGQAAK